MRAAVLLLLLLLLLASLMAVGFTREGLGTEEDTARKAVRVDHGAIASRGARAAGPAKNSWIAAADAVGPARNSWIAAADAANPAKNLWPAAGDAAGPAKNLWPVAGDAPGSRGRQRQRKLRKLKKKVKSKKSKTRKESRNPSKVRKTNRKTEGNPKKRNKKRKNKKSQKLKVKKGNYERKRKRGKRPKQEGVAARRTDARDTARVPRESEHSYDLLITLDLSPDFLEVCSSTYTLGYGESIIIYSDNTGQKSACKNTIKSPAGTKIGFSCPNFNLNLLGCRKEKIILVGKVDGSYTKKTFCDTQPPEGIVLETNELMLRYKRKTLTQSDCSGGFVCALYTVGDPTTVVVATTKAPTVGTTKVPQTGTTAKGPTTTPVGPTASTPVLCSIKRPYCDGCGAAPISVGSEKVVNGSDASEGEYPYQVNLSGCGGSLIKKKWVLTAAHCFDGGQDVKEVEVILGAIKRKGSEPGKLVLSASRIIVHEKYSAQRFENDIALIELSQEVTFTDKIKPICLAEDGDIPFGGKAVATGWGVLKYGTYNFPKVLQEVELDVTTDEVCSNLGAANPAIFICALTQYKDTCVGDSGGPLVAKTCDGRWVQIGVVSHGEGCASPNRPGVYTRVPAYTSWITSKTGSDSC